MAATWLDVGFAGTEEAILAEIPVRRIRCEALGDVVEAKNAMVDVEWFFGMFVLQAEHH